MKKHILISFLILCNTIAYGQINQGGVPYSFKANIKLNPSIFNLSNEICKNSSNTRIDKIDKEIVTTDDRVIVNSFRYL